MNEIVYNILRKIVESPCEVEYGGWGDVRIKGKYVLSIKCREGMYYSYHYSLTDKECRRILRGIEYAEAIKIRNL
tara:strand:+ start:799 stop:1023 length:225 start_codon:yes stop_codon:yes gene_type:complete